MSSWTVSVKVDISKLENLVMRLSNINAMMEDIAQQLKDETVGNIVSKHIIDTGALRDSIEYTMTSDGFTLHDGVEYGIYNEFGTRRGMIARPFMTPASEKFGQIADTVFKELIR